MHFFVETERLIMREMLPTDDAGMFQLDSDPDVHLYIGRKPVQYIEQSREVIEIVRKQYEINGIGRWAVIEKETGAFIGWSGLKLITEPINGRKNHLDLGYRFIKQYWGKGYAKETAIASAAYAWDVLNAKELCGIVHIHNIASRKTLQSVGLRYVENFDYDGSPYEWYEMKRQD
ncbi:GNAT family N-acetyltransferase [Taibaiella lutea]|uniref:GNAT family N-acetyltransferase n=1 Tax=Taibaiella lutea TaxID=2608001 RepID=A0A5M6CGI5_9BACT|nr:GNAT family N-acetyltransferase [Taibaiella lutea]KAA5532545.1 GNAT family N-acetyltransferase [Taibaiella lutea]